ncbi:MAG: hypothetical protein FWF49_01060 [Oscillospiraceae bacterium]|nr:hypothetical protein [Oscillospiraceae bacterium]
MSHALVDAIKRNTENLFENAGIMLQTCDLECILCDLPVWKHVYHQFYSLDQWFINPHRYTEPAFHVPGLNSLNEVSEKILSREDLQIYLETIRVKIMGYVDSLTDEMLSEVPGDCRDSRLSLILSQFRHFYAHLGNINATTIMATNKWPRVVGVGGTSGKSTEGLFE